MSKYSDLPRGEQPKDKAARFGIKALSNAELISIAAGIDDVETTHNLIEATENGIKDLATMLPQDFVRAGLTQTQARKLALALEVGERLNVQMQFPERFAVPGDVANAAAGIADAKQEHFIVFSINRKHELIGKDEISIGTLSETFVSVKDAVLPALRRGAYGIMLAHNHPSGDTTPSEMDVDTTKKLINAAALYDVKVLDHVIVAGGGSHYSMRKMLGIDFFSPGQYTYNDKVNIMLKIERDKKMPGAIVYESYAAVYSGPEPAPPPPRKGR
jgi:DNA repair protein RadC